ncbi:Putative major facilitator superfamily, MFS transporter superfamily [Septoria linicola]|uniref:Major facilitator superfamily, MFS transporter superfamily n=1 Tax=Septoria linicola TaxID=215465 RepID=A0A9Q9B435_9PEZI|nr:Putative major facilitator superfamily, MFS transporter superfamily [Septoria linicola]
MADLKDDDHGNIYGRSETTLAVTISMLLVCTIFVGFRMLSRVAIVKKITWDDYFMLLAWAITVGLCASICLGTVNGLGRHEVDVPDSWQPSLRKSNYAFSVLYQPALMATKTSILAFYLTFSTTERLFKWGCYATLFVVNAGGLALTLITVFQCSPVSAAFYAITPTTARCTDILTIYLSSIPLNIITDLAILFLPMPVLTSMRLPRKQKIILLVTFSFGIFVTVVDVVRVHYLQSAAEMRLSEIASAQATEDSSRNSISTDSSFYLAFSFMWSAIEVTVGIMCACVPGLKPLVARFLPSMLRDPGDAPSNFGSFSGPDAEGQKAAPAIPDMPNEVHYRDFGKTSGQEEAEEQGGAMGMMEFLTTPDMDEFYPMERSPTALTNTTRNTAPRSPTFFDFVNMKQKKSFVYMTAQESFYPVAIVTVLFFVWGFEYGLVDVLNTQFQTVASITTAQSVGIRSAYYCGYLIGPFSVGQWVLKHWGFKSCFPVGLSIYACGCLIFWPAAVLTSWPTFLVTNFIVGFGLSLLEVSANAFIALCGPAQYAEIRLNFSQGVQAVGGVVAPLIAEKAFYHKTSHAPSLINTQWAYLGISLFTVALAVVYFYLPLPEATDAELEDAAERMDGANKTRVGGVRIIWYILGLGVFSEFCYVGAQEVVGTSFGSYLNIAMPQLSRSNYFAIAHTAFAVSRFLAAGLGFWITPRVLLLAFYCGVIIFAALCTHFTGGTAVAMLTMVFFCEGPLFSLIFAQALRGQGRHTKFASVLLTASIGGGAIFSPISTALVANGRSVPYSLVVAVAAFAGGTVFALGLNISKAAQLVVDPIKDPSMSRAREDRPGSTSSRASRALSFLSFGKKNRDSSGVEYRERKVSTPIEE